MWILGFSFAWSINAIAALPIDETKLPPPAQKQVDFARDIKPIFDASCIRCHGPVKPKSGFRLDNRISALKGGDNGVDIIPGHSAKSSLIHFTAQLVADMEMPPPDKGEPLSAAQIGLLRAWIDQGAAWEMVVPTNSQVVAFSGLFGGTTVDGHNQKFRELYWRREGPYGGMTDFSLARQDNPDTTLILAGHVLPDDYKAELLLDRNELGFIHSGAEQYRKYYNDVGGYFPPASPTAFSMDRNLYLTLGKAWVDFGLTLPNWPRMVVGYEYDFREGNEGSTSWGAAGKGANDRNLAPASEQIHEGTHVIKFDLDGEYNGVTVEDRFRGEFYNLKTFYTNTAARSSVQQSVGEHNSYFQGANTIRLEKQFKDWLFGSAGYLYSKLESDASFTNLTVAFGTRYVGNVPEITLSRESHVANVNALLGPFDGMTFSVGAQGEWTAQHGFGTGQLNQIPFTATVPLTLAIVPTTLLSDYDEKSATETLEARYTKIPFTALFFDVRLKQDSIAENENDLQQSGDYVENVAYSSELKDLRLGFSTSPWRTVSLTADYRRYENDSHYPPNAPPQPAGGYPDYFISRQLITDEVEAKLVVRPCNWLKTVLSYEFSTTDFRDDANPAVFQNSVVVATGGNTLTGRSDSQTYTISTILTPHPRVYIDASFSYQPNKTTTADSGYPVSAPYKGDTYTADLSGTYVLSETTDFTVTGIFSDADYGQRSTTATVPVDIRYQEYGLTAGLNRHFNKNLSAGLQYGFNYYHEPSSGDANDFRAHTVFATLNYRLP